MDKTALFRLLQQTLSGGRKKAAPSSPVIENTGRASRWNSTQPDRRRQRYTVIDKVPETSDCVTVRLQAENSQLQRFEPGQYLTFNIPHTTACRTQATQDCLRRPYSMSSTPADNALQITVKTVPDGRASTWINQELQVGDVLEAVGPAGDFTVRAAAANQKRFLLVAGGVGITPVFSLLRAWLESDEAVSLKLLYCNRSHDQVIFQEALSALANDPRLELILHSDADDGLMTPADFKRLSQDWLDADAYVCGPAGLMEMVETQLAASGMPASRIHSERFLSAKNVELPTSAQPIFFVRSGREVVQQPGETILDAALRDGLELPYSCTMGGCAHCRQTRLNGSGGIVMDEPNCLTPNEVEKGDFLACCSYATGPVEIDA